jgi:hypothetical protein
MQYNLVRDFSVSSFKSVTGVSPSTFRSMVSAVRRAYFEVHKKRGRHRKLCCEDMVLMLLEYYKEYRTLACIGASYGLQKCNVGKTIKWVEEVLIRCGLFSLLSKKKLVHPDVEYEVIVVDTTESPIQRPKHNQGAYYSGKKNGIQ